MIEETEMHELLRGFEDLTLPKARWTHLAHVAVALVYTRAMGAEHAAPAMRARLRAYNTAVAGNADGYHETITFAWIALLDDFLRGVDRERPPHELFERALEHAADKQFLLRFYSEAVLTSAEARSCYMPPDVAPLAWPRER